MNRGKRFMDCTLFSLQCKLISNLQWSDTTSPTLLSLLSDAKRFLAVRHEYRFWVATRNAAKKNASLVPKLERMP